MPLSRNFFFKKYEVYYESKREPQIRGITKCRCDERLQTKTKEKLLDHIRCELIAKWVSGETPGGIFT